MKRSAAHMHPHAFSGYVGGGGGGTPMHQPYDPFRAPPLPMGPPPPMMMHGAPPPHYFPPHPALMQQQQPYYSQPHQPRFFGSSGRGGSGGGGRGGGGVGHHRGGRGGYGDRSGQQRGGQSHRGGHGGGGSNAHSRDALYKPSFVQDPWRHLTAHLQPTPPEFVWRWTRNNASVPLPEPRAGIDDNHVQRDDDGGDGDDDSDDHIDHSDHGDMRTDLDESHVAIDDGHLASRERALNADLVHATDDATATEVRDDEEHAQRRRSALLPRSQFSRRLQASGDDNQNHVDAAVTAAATTTSAAGVPTVVPTRSRLQLPPPLSTESHAANDE